MTFYGHKEAITVTAKTEALAITLFYIQTGSFKTPEAAMRAASDPNTDAQTIGLADGISLQAGDVYLAFTHFSYDEIALAIDECRQDGDGITAELIASTTPA